MADAIRPHLEDRRCGPRFPLRLAAECTFHKTKEPVTFRCEGEVQNLSARGCCVILSRPALIAVGMVAHLWIDWPARLHEDAERQFHTWGRVLRVEGERIAVGIRTMNSGSRAGRAGGNRASVGRRPR